MLGRTLFAAWWGMGVPVGRTAAAAAAGAAASMGSMPRLDKLRADLAAQQDGGVPAPVAGAGAAVSGVAASGTKGPERSVHIATYGCAMNVADSEVVRALLLKEGYAMAPEPEGADVVLLNTCAIRDNAEATVWNRLRALRQQSQAAGAPRSLRTRRVGLLGCMAERLKDKLLEGDRLVDLVVGPDAYRDLPRLLGSLDDRDTAINTLLSADETYADIAPVRADPGSHTAFVSIMRGCNNMCAFCIVPRTRGRERSRPMGSILREVEDLAAAGVREVTLLGQNVNSYQDLSSTPSEGFESFESSAGFTPFIKRRDGGVRFAELLDAVARVDPSMRIRFTSPHPQHFPLVLLDVMARHGNLCNSIHLPAQSGSDTMLAAMRRGYTAESYLDLVATIRDTLPDVQLSSDFISGFCGETDADHAATLDLLDAVQYSKAYMFAYSMRERTHAHRKMTDDVPEPVKKERLAQVIESFKRNAAELHAREVGKTVVVLVDGSSKKVPGRFVGRSDANLTVSFDPPADGPPVQVGDYVAVTLTGSGSHTQVGQGIEIISTPTLPSSF